MGYVRQQGDTEQKCPYCGRHWLHTMSRYNEQYRKGYFDYVCKGCGAKWRVRWTEEEGYSHESIPNKIAQ